jgi:predicted nucleic acid-binding protein
VPDLPWIQVQVPTASEVEEVVRGLDAHDGEQETLALGLRGTVVPAIDERAARRYARERGVVTTSTLALEDSCLCTRIGLLAGQARMN